MTQFKLKALFLALLLGVATAPHVQAGLGAEMQGLFNGMKNSTPPGVYKSQNRMTLDGGGYFERVPITDTELVNLEFPSFSGGCGGINMNFGSLSFIDGDQFLQLLTNIGKNAKGYIFQLAMDNVFPEGAKWMDAMQEKIAEMNRYLGNSCEAAKLAVDTVSDMPAIKSVTDSTLTGIASAKGYIKDQYQGFTGGDANDTSADTTQAKMCRTDVTVCLEEKGNLTYQSLKRQNVQSWFVSDDAAMLPVILSVSGSKVIAPVEEDTAEPGKQGPIKPLPGHYLKLKHLVAGGDVPVYECKESTVNGQTFSAEDECLEVDKTTLDIKGLHTMIKEAIAGSATNMGVIDKWADPSIGAVTEDEKKVMALLPQGVGGLLKAISRRGSPGAAKTTALGFTESLAYYAAYQLSDEILNATIEAIRDNTKNSQNDLLSEIRQAKVDYANEFQVKLDEGSILRLPEMISHAQKLMSILPKPVVMKLQ